VRTYLLATAIAALAIGSSNAETPRIFASPPLVASDFFNTLLVKLGCLDIDTERFDPELGRCSFFVPWSPQENGDTPDEAILYSKDQTDSAPAIGSTHVETPLVIVRPGQLVRFGCLEIADTERIERLREAEDHTAVRSILEGGRCTYFVPWLPEQGADTTDDAFVYFEDETDEDFGCIRPDIGDGCYWMRKTYYKPFARG
jgi:hypothetical protein